MIPDVDVVAGGGQAWAAPRSNLRVDGKPPLGRALLPVLTRLPFLRSGSGPLSAVGE
jgi:hypothetical protein